MGRLKSWWQGKYRLPATHPLFQDQTVAELFLEQLGDILEEKASIERQLTGDGMSGRNVGALQQRLTQLNEALGEKGGDDLIDFWEEELKAGRTPDLDMTAEDLAEARRRQG